MNSNSEHKSSRRSSILKPAKQRHPLQPVNTVSSSNENTPTAKLKRRVSFAEKKHVKEFCNSPEQGTVWDNTYEEHDLSNGKDIGSSTKTSCSTQNISIERQEEAIASELSLGTKSPIPVYRDDTSHAVSTLLMKNLSLEQVLQTSPESEIIPVYQDTDNINNNEMSKHIVSNIECIGTNINVYEEGDQNESLEFTEAISTGHNQLFSRCDVNKTQYFQDMSVEYTANVPSNSNVICNIKDNIQDVSMDLTKVVSAYVWPNNKKFDHTQEDRTTIFQDKKMEFTAPIVCLLNGQSTNKLSLETHAALNDQRTTVFTDVPMEITEVVRPESTIEFLAAKEAINREGLNETQVYDNDAMEITAIVTEDEKVNANTNVNRSCKVTSEPTMNIETNALTRPSTSMILTEMVPSHIVNRNALHDPLNKIRMDNNDIQNMSMELTAIVPKQLLSGNTETAESQRDKTIVYKDMSMEITNVIQKPIDTNIQLLLNKENNSSSSTRKRVRSGSPWTEKLQELSMEFTTAVSNPMLDKENNFVPHIRRHESINTDLNLPDLSRNKISRLNNISIHSPNEFSSAIMESLLHKDSNETSDQLGDADTDNFGRNSLEHEIIGNGELNQSMSMEMTNAVQVVASHDKHEESIKNLIANGARRSVHNEKLTLLHERSAETISTPALEKNNIEKACYLDKEKIATNPDLDNRTITPVSNLSNNEHQVSCLGLSEKRTNETLMTGTLLNDNEALRTPENTDRLEEVNHADENSFYNYVSVLSKTLEELESIKPPWLPHTDDSISNEISLSNIAVIEESTSPKNVMKNNDLDRDQRPLESHRRRNNSNTINSSFSGGRQSLICDYQEYNMVRDNCPIVNEREITRHSQTFLINRTSLDNHSLNITGVGEISALEVQQLHLSSVDGDNNKENTILDCTSLDLVKPTTEESVIDNEDAESLEEVKLQITRNDNSISDNQILQSLSASTRGNDNNVHVADDSNRQLCEIETEECSGKFHSEKQTKSHNINGSIDGNQIIEDDNRDSNKETITMDTRTILSEEKEVNQLNNSIVLDPFSSLVNDLKEHSKSDDIIWNIYHENPDQKLILIGFMSCTLLVVMKFCTENLENSNICLSGIKLISRVADDEPNTLVHIVHRLVLETVNIETLILLYKEHKDVLKVLESVSVDVKSAVDFMVEMKKLDNVNLMDFYRDRLSFTCLSKRAIIVVKVTINIKPFNTIRPSDIDIKCESGSVEVDDLKNLIKNVKKDHKFLRRYITDVKDYIDLTLL